MSSSLMGSSYLSWVAPCSCFNHCSLARDANDESATSLLLSADELPLKRQAVNTSASKQRQHSSRFLPRRFGNFGSFTGVLPRGCGRTSSTRALAWCTLPWNFEPSKHVGKRQLSPVRRQNRLGREHRGIGCGGGGEGASDDDALSFGLGDAVLEPVLKTVFIEEVTATSVAGSTS